MNSEPIEDLDVPPLSSYTVPELRQLLSLTMQTYEAYKAQDTPSGKIGAKLCHDEMKEIEAILTSVKPDAASGNPPPASLPACTQDTAKGTVLSPALPKGKPEELPSTQALQSQGYPL